MVQDGNGEVSRDQVGKEHSGQVQRLGLFSRDTVEGKLKHL